MKNFLRIAIVILILVALGVGTYLTFFKPANKDEVYLELSKMATYEDSIDEKLYNISSDNFSPAVEKAGSPTGFSPELVNAYNNALNNQNNRKLLTKSSNLIGMNINYPVEDGEDVAYSFNQYSYPQLKMYLDEVFNYYFAYSQAVNKTVPQKELKLMKSSIKEYKESLQSVNADLHSIYVLQDSINKNPAEDLSIELDKRYKKAVVTFRTALNKYANLVENTKNFVTKYVFSGEMITDKDSSLYDLVIKSVITATDGIYSYEDINARKVSDDKMSSATKFIKLAMANDKDVQLNSIFKFDAGTVICDNVAYLKNTKNYKKFDVELRIGEDSHTNKVLYYGNTNYQFDLLKSDIVINDNMVTISVENNLSSSLVALAPVEFTYKNGAYYKTFSFWFDGEDDNRLYFNLASDGIDESGLVIPSSQRFITISTYDNLKVSGENGQIVIPVRDADDMSKKGTVSFEYYEGVFNYYLINSSYYKVNADNMLQSVDNPSFTLQNAQYFNNNIYSKKPYGIQNPERLNYRQMIKSYNKVVKDNPEQIDKLISLSANEKMKFVAGDSSVRVGFLEPYYEDLEYILACYGFFEEVTE